MNQTIIKRVLKEAEYMIQTGSTVREIGNYFGISKSTVHKDLHERLDLIDKKKFIKCDEIMKYHLNVRHIRGGESTKKKYSKVN